MTRAHPFVLDGKRLIVPALLRRLQLFADGDHGRLGRDVEDEHAARRAGEHPAVARQEEGRHARRLHARQRARAEAADDQPIDAIAARRGAPSRIRRCRTRAPEPRSGAARTATGCSSTTISSGAATAWPCRCRRMREQTWRWTRHLERDPESADQQQLGEYHYPSIIQAADGTLHATYSYFVAGRVGRRRMPRSACRASRSSTRISTRRG